MVKIILCKFAAQYTTRENLLIIISISNLILHFNVCFTIVEFVSFSCISIFTITELFRQLGYYYYYYHYYWLMVRWSVDLSVISLSYFGFILIKIFMRITIFFIYNYYHSKFQIFPNTPFQLFVFDVHSLPCNSRYIDLAPSINDTMQLTD